MAIQDYLTLSHFRKVVAAITQRIVGVENSVSDINGAIEELRNDKEVFVITIGWSGTNTVPSATYQEIQTAMSEGKIPVVLSDNLLYDFKSTTWNGDLIFVSGYHAILITGNDEAIDLFNEISILYNSTNNKWEVTPFDYIFYMPGIFNYLRIYNSNSNKYYEGTLHEFSRLSYIDYETGDTVIFTNTDSSVNEWTKTVRSAPYAINITDRNSATTLVSDKSPSEISDVYYSEKQVFAFVDASTVPTGQYQLSDIINSPTESAVVFSNGFCEIKVTETQVPAAVAEIGGKYSCEYTYIGIPNDIDSAIDGQILTYDDTNSMWVNSDLPSIPTASSTTPSSDGTGAVGVSTAYARADHVHPKITQSLSISSNVITLTGSDGTTSSVTLPVYNGGVSS